MFKIKKFASIALVLSLSGCLFSCSNDDDNNNPSNSVKDLFPNGVPSRIGYTSLSFKGGTLVGATCDVKEDDWSAKYSISYKQETFKGESYDVVINYESKDGYNNETEIFKYYVKLNEDGYARLVRETGDSDTEISLTYDNEDHLVQSHWQEVAGRDSETTTLRYDNGDLTLKRTKYGSTTVNEYFDYVTDSQTQAIENKGNVMIFNGVYNFYITPNSDVATILYYAGLLGKGTANLPLQGECDGYTQSVKWEFNKKGLPTKVEYDSEITEIVW